MGELNKFYICRQNKQNQAKLKLRESPRVKTADDLCRAIYGHSRKPILSHKWESVGKMGDPGQRSNLDACFARAVELIWQGDPSQTCGQVKAQLIREFGQEIAEATLAALKKV